MGGIRDRLIHDYFGVDYDIVWDVVTRKIPDLLLKSSASSRRWTTVHVDYHEKHASSL